MSATAFISSSDGERVAVSYCPGPGKRAERIGSDKMTLDEALRFLQAKAERDGVVITAQAAAWPADASVPFGKKLGTFGGESCR